MASFLDGQGYNDIKRQTRRMSGLDGGPIGQKIKTVGTDPTKNTRLLNGDKVQPQLPDQESQIPTPPPIEMDDTPEQLGAGIEGAPVANEVKKVGLDGDFGKTTEDYLKGVMSGQDELTQGLLNRQSQESSARAASMAGKAGQEAELRGLGDTAKAASVQETDRQVESIRQGEISSLSQLVMNRSDQASMNLLTTELQQAGQDQLAFEAFMVGADIEADRDQINDLYKKAYGGDAPSYSELSNIQKNNAETLAGADVTRYMQTMGYNIGNIPAYEAGSALEKKLSSLYNSQHDTEWNGEDPAPDNYANWRKTFTESSVSSETLEESNQAKAEYTQDLINQGYADAEGNLTPEGQSKLNSWVAKNNFLKDSGWETITLPSGEDGYLDENGVPIGMEGFTGNALDEGYYLQDGQGGLFVNVGNQELKVTQTEDGSITYQEKDENGEWGESLSASNSSILSNSIEDLVNYGVISEEGSDVGTSTPFNPNSASSIPMFDTLKDENATTDDIMAAVQWGLDYTERLTAGEKRDFYRDPKVINELKSSGTPSFKSISSSKDGSRDGDKRRIFNAPMSGFKGASAVGKTFIKDGVVYEVVSPVVNYKTGSKWGQSFEYKKADGTGSVIWEKNI